MNSSQHISTSRAETLFEELSKRGESAIDELITSRKSEELFLDFKQSADGGEGRSLHDRDNNSFAKAISGFGNSEGGIVVWGVDCSADQTGADVASKKIPLADAKGFASRLENAVSRLSIPVHPLVRNIALPIEGGEQGFVVSLIPKSDLAPHQTIPGQQYYMRAGSSFVPVPHGVLAGMFGRRPAAKPQIRFIMPYMAEVANNKLKFEVGLSIHNRGVVIARDLFMTVQGRSIPSEVGSLAFEFNDHKNWVATKAFGIQISVISNPQIRLAPQAFFLPLTLHFQIGPPWVKDLKITGIAGCEGGAPDHFDLSGSLVAIQTAYEEIMREVSAGKSAENLLREFPEICLGKR